ncbi:uncharacterized protein LOC113561026 [Rhopalosiphum maidis]|uniref:uncharacterized protein LOC113561026 n=1 Tax=Rhopalosiphum maidis TaxID=43146 RepID=UPI000F0090D7|nr:uncharacterized protein LOC113561026 [Rhopalosiphum maidis]
MVSVQRVLIVLCIVVCHLMVASAQFNFGDFLSNVEQSSNRDPRENRGPVLFPATQPGSETSGVVVGASGFGFVPPGGNKQPPQGQNIFSFW